MIKVSIISGFLGAGKTTLISKLIKEELHKENIVLIENEFGEIGIDGGFLKEAGIQIKEMNSGCICCSLQGDFKEALNKVVETYHPEHIIIEPSGVGKLSDVIKAVEAIDGLEVCNYTTVVDSKKVKMYSKNFKEFYNDQIESSSCVILSRTQEIDQDKLKEDIDIIKALNSDCRIVTTPWDQLSAMDIINAMEGSIDLLKEDHRFKKSETCIGEDCEEEHHEHDEECECGHHHHEHEEECECGHHHHEHEEECECGHHHHEHDEECECGHHHHHADEVFTSIGFETVNRYSKKDLKFILSSLDENIIRCKGIVQDPEGSWLHFDFVPEDIDIRQGASNYTGLITVIGTSFDANEIKKLFGVK